MKIRLISILICFFTLIACHEKEFSEDYDIKFPSPVITDIQPVTEYIGGEVEVLGENLDGVVSLSLGNINCEILEKSPNSLKFKVPRTSERNNILVENKYRKSSKSSQFFTPQYYDVVITSWPSKLEKGRTFVIQGENVDLITTAFVNGTEVERSGVPSPNKITFSLKNVELDETGLITIKTKTNQELTSPVIDVVEPSDVFIPMNTIVLCDFDEVMPEIISGNPSGPGAQYEAGLNKTSIVQAFGNYYSVTAPLGNGWNGMYQELKCTNNGQGYDLSLFTDPHITFLVNTNGKQGYFNPRLTINGASGDKHFTGQNGEYPDNYKFKTVAWEWRSYSLLEMGFDTKGLVESIDLLIRGANVGNNNNEAFEINIDQVLITDGPLKPTILSCFDKLPNIEGGSAVLDGGTNFSDAGEGLHYLSVKSDNVQKWQSLGKITYPNMSAEQYQNSMYINFMVNTGVANGYMQLIFLQNGTEYGMHFKGENPYGDNYNFGNTEGHWEWRSYLIDPSSLEIWNGDGTGLDVSAPFDFIIEFKTGNIEGKYEMNLDYVTLTAAPLDKN